MRNNEVSQCVLFRSRMNRAMEMSFCKFSQQVAVMYNYSGSREVLYLRSHCELRATLRLEPKSR